MKRSHDDTGFESTESTDTTEMDPRVLMRLDLLYRVLNSAVISSGFLEKPSLYHLSQANRDVCYIVKQRIRSISGGPELLTKLQRDPQYNEFPGARELTLAFTRAEPVSSSTSTTTSTNSIHSWSIPHLVVSNTHVIHLNQLQSLEVQLPRPSIVYNKKSRKMQFSSSADASKKPGRRKKQPLLPFNIPDPFQWILPFVPSSLVTLKLHSRLGPSGVTTFAGMANILQSTALPSLRHLSIRDGVVPHALMDIILPAIYTMQFPHLQSLELEWSWESQHSYRCPTEDRATEYNFIGALVSSQYLPELRHVTLRGSPLRNNTLVNVLPDTASTNSTKCLSRFSRFRTSDTHLHGTLLSFVTSTDPAWHRQYFGAVLIHSNFDNSIFRTETFSTGMKNVIQLSSN